MFVHIFFIKLNCIQLNVNNKTIMIEISIDESISCSYNISVHINYMSSLMPFAITITINIKIITEYCIAVLVIFINNNSQQFNQINISLDSTNLAIQSYMHQPRVNQLGQLWRFEVLEVCLPYNFFVAFVAKSGLFSAGFWLN